MIHDLGKLGSEGFSTAAGDEYTTLTGGLCLRPSSMGDFEPWLCGLTSDSEERRNP